MRIGIFGSADDLQTQHLTRQLESHKVDVLVVDAHAPLKQIPLSFDGQHFWYGQENTSDVGCWFMRHIMMAVPDMFYAHENYQLYRDWHVAFLRRREAAVFQFSWLISEAICRGIPVVNPPAYGSVLQLKPYQLARARQLGFQVPATLITTDPEAARAFAQRYPHVVYKPTLGGGLCRVLDAAAEAQLDQIKVSPVTFQEAVIGVSLRVTLVNSKVVSVVAIPTETIDYRADPDYIAGQTQYLPQILPDDVQQRLENLVAELQLSFAGVDLIQTGDGDYVFIEANPSPIYYEIERQTGHPITSRIAETLIQYVQAPPAFTYHLQSDPRLPGLVGYTNPFDPYGEPWG